MAGTRLSAPRPRAPRHGDRRRGRSGWPDTEDGLRALPGVGRYTARALRVLAFGAGTIPPQDVNIARVTARAALGKEPDDVRQACHRGAARRRQAARHDRAHLHVRPLRRRRAALPGATAVPRVPAAATCLSRDRLADVTARATPTLAAHIAAARASCAARCCAPCSPNPPRRASASCSDAPDRPAAGRPAERHRSGPRRPRPRGIG